jgi:hypothetical protein
VFHPNLLFSKAIVLAFQSRLNRNGRPPEHRRRPWDCKFHGLVVKNVNDPANKSDR